MFPLGFLSASTNLWCVLQCLCKQSMRFARTVPIDSHFKCASRFTFKAAPAASHSNIFVCSPSETRTIPGQV